MRLLQYVLLVALLTAAACAPPFSRDLLDTVDLSLTFRDIRMAPDRYRGERILLGGMIISVRNTADGGVIEVLQRPIDRQARPRRTDHTEGRFLARTDAFIDSAVYYAGRDISMIGEVTGTQTLRLDEVDYTYPVVSVQAVHLWQPSSAPRFFFSIGVGHYH